MVTKKFGVDFDSCGGALTLRHEYIGTNASKWNITGDILSEDIFMWINDFEAEHPIFGKVWGNFEHEVYADSEEGYNNFVKKHPPEAWDYENI